MGRCVYSLPDYGRMLGEPSRFGAFRRALERAISPGDVVIDLGAGPGVFALLAARAGAGRVYAVEPDPVLTLLPELARLNGASNIEPIHGLSTTFEPAKRADVIISDLRGVLPTFTDHLPSVIDARRRLLAEGGRLIARRDVIWAAPVHAPQERKRQLGGFEVDGLDLGLAAERASHHWTRVELEESALLAEPQRVAALDYRVLESANVSAELEFELQSQPILDGAALDGIAVWFDTELDGHESFSNAPSQKMIYGQAFFPFRHAFEARRGDRLSLRFAAHHIPGEDYLYRWSGRLERGGEVVGRYQHSTFHGVSLSPSALASRSPDHRPSLVEGAALSARIDATIVELLDGGGSIGEVSELLQERFPGELESAHDALRRVCRVADRYAVGPYSRRRSASA